MCRSVFGRKAREWVGQLQEQDHRNLKYYVKAAIILVATLPARLVRSDVHLLLFTDCRGLMSSKLQGRGLEIGALGRPLQTHDRMRMEYVDRHDVSTLRTLYPELARDRLVEPHIIDDAERLDSVPDQTYDFVVAAHVLEHMANPIGAVRSWCRVLKPGGLLYLAVPDRRLSFDRKRPRTLLGHLVLDFERASAERDYEHFLEYAVLVANARPDDAIAEADRLWQMKYSIHYHVFEPRDVVTLVQWFSGHIAPLEIVLGPVWNLYTEEFHILLRSGSGQN
jgi:SAM-dependent methyltransferase